MNEGLQNKLFETACANNISYILKDSNDFSVTGYKVMRNQTDAGLLRCVKVMYNGRIKLVYLVGEYKPLSYVAGRYGVNELNAVIFNLLQRTSDIKANGFFRAENLELDFGKVFVDTSDFSVHLIYFPLAGEAAGKTAAFESEFRVALINLFNSFPVFNAPQFQKLCSDLANGSLPPDMLIRRLQENISGNNRNFVFGESPAPAPDNFNRVSPRGACVGSAYPDPSNNASPYGGVGSGSPVPDGGKGGANFAYGGEWDCRNMNRFERYMRSEFRGETCFDTPHIKQPVMTVAAVNSPIPFSLTVNKSDYRIGKNPDMVDGAVTYNPAISRVHCRITFYNGRYYITDMDSANGTYVNQQRLFSREMRELNSGDSIRLANSDFVISF